MTRIYILEPIPLTPSQRLYRGQIDLTKYLHLPIVEAAHQMRVSKTTLGRYIRQHEIDWRKSRKYGSIRYKNSPSDLPNNLIKTNYGKLTRLDLTSVNLSDDQDIIDALCTLDK